MAVLAAILPIVSRSSALALELYRLAASELNATKHLNMIARSISSLALIVKQVGTIVKEDDRLPSPEAIETLEDIIDQCTAILNEIESILPQQAIRQSVQRNDNRAEPNRGFQLSSAVVTRLDYLVAHLDSLKATLSVMLQTLYTAQSIMWARVRPTVSPQQGSRAIANEKNQLETLIVEQQMSILLATKLYEPSRPDARLLMEKDSSQSLIAVEGGPPKPGDLFKYQDKYLATFDASNSNEEHWLPAVCGISKSQLDRLLERWTRLRRFDEELRDAERRAEAQKKETQQPYVESDSEDEVHSLPKSAGSGVRLATPTPRSGSTQPLFTETATLPIPGRDSRFASAAPLSPASSYGASPRSSGSNLPIPHQPGFSPVSPRSSIATLPIEAAAAVEAKDKDEDIDLEIPWTLCTRRHYWKYVDDKIVDSNTEAPSSTAFSDRHSWTEILASWVCKEAIQEAEFKYTQVQKDRRDGRRTKFETCFCIEQPLTFDQVHRLVERTVEIYRQTQPPSPPARGESRRTSFERRPVLNISPPSFPDRDRTPLADQKRHPPLERSTTSFPPPPPHPPLDRSTSMPGQIPNYQSNPCATNLHLPISHAGSPQTAPYAQQAAPYSPHPVPQSASYSPQSVPFSSQNTVYASPQSLHPPGSAPFGLTYNHQPPDSRHLQPGTYLPSPLREPHSHQGYHRDYYFSTSNSSESDSTTRSRKHRSRSRRRSDSRRKKGHEHSGATKALMGVAGLTALLDGLVGV